ncbi:MAG: hypothetical protein Q9162_003767 [Coniocarpon cinnabarinum]
MQRMQEHERPAHPTPLKTHSFSRFESPSVRSPPTDPASILTGNPSPLVSSPHVQTPDRELDRSHSDIFDTQDEDEPTQTPKEEQHDVDFERMGELPIEIQSLLERFLETLSLQSSSAALSIDRLSELYQDFYVHVESHIATHIATLSSRLAREKSPSPSLSSTGSAASSRGGRRATRERPPPLKKRESEQQLLTPSEVSDRRKARRQLELKKLAMEEAVERGVCERVYPRLWRHSLTDDESRDAKLRSRAAALSVVGVDLKELLSTAMASDGESTPDPSMASNSERDEVKEKLNEARSQLELVNEDRYPQAKLQRLSSVHKKIVESLSLLFPSSSSADEILPTLIYVIIISPPETLSVVSNLLFIQRFRNQSKLDGEAAYCLTNLEAAISFLETVDLSSIRRDELPQGPQKHDQNSHGSSTPRSEKSDPMFRGLPLSPPQPGSNTAKSPKHGRRLSQLMSSKPANPLEGAVDSAYDAMHNALDGSFKFLFGRIKEKQATQSPAKDGGTPKTLEDAHKLVTRDADKDLADLENENSGHGLGVRAELSSPNSNDDASRRMLELIGGKRATDRGQHSADAQEVLGKKLQNVNASLDKAQGDNASIASHTSSSTASTTAPLAGGNNAFESMRNFSNSINLNPFSYKGFSMRGPNKNTPPSAPPSSTASPGPGEGLKSTQVDGATPESNAPAAQPLTRKVDLNGIGPPVQRFIGIKDAKELNGYDVELLLRDYQRLAGAIKALRS